MPPEETHINLLTTIERSLQILNGLGCALPELSSPHSPVHGNIQHFSWFYHTFIAFHMTKIWKLLEIGIAKINLKFTHNNYSKTIMRLQCTLANMYKYSGASAICTVHNTSRFVHHKGTYNSSTTRIAPSISHVHPLTHTRSCTLAHAHSLMHTRSCTLCTCVCLSQGCATGKG